MLQESDTVIILMGLIRLCALQTADVHHSKRLGKNCDFVGGWVILATTQMLKLNLILHLTAAALEIALLALLVIRKLAGKFIFLFLYLACSLIGDAAKTWILGNGAEFYLYSWLLQGVYALLASAVIIEVFKPAFKLILSRLGVQGILIPVAFLLLLDFAFWMRFHHRFGSDLPAVLASVISSFDLGFCCLSSVMFFFALWCEPRYGILRQYRLGILVGFGLLSISTLLTYFVRLNLGGRFESWFQVVPGLAFAGATLGWFLTFISEEPKPPVGDQDPEKLQNLLLLLNDTLEIARRIGRRFGIRLRRQLVKSHHYS